ncbi:hypothetical protein [Mycetocola sp. JXN-3]|uniref:hypothetical protein n=1 Tax=Mycetocola sp. JXN-3 TaxID=2116510 RepID=UPI00165D1EB7|nr:hypothetical protein [Mycetocola sp. JXN-3]
MDTPDDTTGAVPSPEAGAEHRADPTPTAAPLTRNRSRGRTGARRRRGLIFGSAAAAVLIAGGIAAWAGGLFGPGAATQVSSSLTKYDIKVSDGSGAFVDATREKPLPLTSPGLASDLIGEGLEWTVTVKNEGAATGQLFFVVCDPMSAKVKYRVAPGKDVIYPDLFTQLRFTITDDAGTVVLNNQMLGADENNDPNGDGTLRADISRILEAGGGEATFTIRAVFDYDREDASRTKLAAYNGVDTDFGVRIEGESY